MGAARSPGDVEKAMRRIEDEAARMGVLVEDLLTLARLDEVREAEHVEVDLAALARDAADDARAMAPDREIRCTPTRPR
jgi:two-component system, OmpR family, sensor kinase